MLQKSILVATLWLCACEPVPPSAPNIVSIEPEEVVRGEPATLTLKLDAPLPMRVDYGAKTATLLVPPTLRIGGQEVAVEGLEPDGTLRATVPADLTEGQQEIRLVLGDGSEAVREQGLIVLPAPPSLEPETDAGGPGPRIGGGDEDNQTRSPPLQFGIDPIPDQLRGVPFVVTLRAEGPEAARFEGRVQFTTNKGRITPNLSHPFQQGVLQERVVIDKQGGNVVLTVRIGDTLVRSNPFKVSNH